MSHTAISRQSSLLRSTLALLSLPLALLAGCSMGGKPTDSIQVAPATLSGKVFGGQQPVTGSSVTVWAAGTSTYGSAATLLASSTSDANGNFTFANTPYTCPTGATQVYLLAKGGNSGFGTGSNSAIALAAGIGNCSSAQSQTVNINEVSTAATAFALAQFFTPILGSASTDSFGAPAGTPSLALANNSTIPTLINLPSGTVNPNTSTITIESAKIYTIANILAACVNTAGGTGACSTLFANTTPPGSSNAPSDTLQAAVQMALYPYQNVSTLFGLITAAGAPFVGLPAQPSDFTLGVSYTAPNLGLAIATNTSSSIDIDSTGRIWFPSNKPGAVGAAVFDPSSNTFAGPYSTSSIVSPQYIALDQANDVWLTDQSSDTIYAFEASNPATNGAVSMNAAIGSGTNTGGPVTINPDGTVFLAFLNNGVPSIGQVIPSTNGFDYAINTFFSNPTGIIAVDTGNPPENFLITSTGAPSTPCNLEFEDIIGPDISYGVENNTATNCVSGGAALATNQVDALTAATTTNQILSFNDGVFTPTVPLNLPEGIATDGLGHEWIANSGNGSISTFGGVNTNTNSTAADYPTTSPIAYLHNASNGATMTQPYGLAIDGAGNVWAANASCIGACTPSSFTLSELIGAAAPTITPLSLQFGGDYTGTEPLPVTAPTFRPAARPNLARPRVVRPGTSSQGTRVPFLDRPNVVHVPF
jgi:hypothetical protein